MSRTFQYRKVMKPLLERKRRARINKCLDELKDLMMFVLERDGENPNKLEKADILEVTVSHLRKLKQSGSLVSPLVTYSHRFRDGYSACASEVTRFLTAPGSPTDRLAVDSVLSQVVSSARIVESLPPNLLTAVAEQSRVPYSTIPYFTSSRNHTSPPRCGIKPEPRTGAVVSPCTEPSAGALDLSREKTEPNTDQSWRPW